MERLKLAYCLNQFTRYGLRCNPDKRWRWEGGLHKIAWILINRDLDPEGYIKDVFDRHKPISIAVILSEKSVSRYAQDRDVKVQLLDQTLRAQIVSAYARIAHAASLTSSEDINSIFTMIDRDVCPIVAVWLRKQFDANVDDALESKALCEVRLWPYGFDKSPVGRTLIQDYFDANGVLL